MAKRIRISFSIEELAVLKVVLSNVGGDPDNSIRNITDRVLHKIAHHNKSVGYGTELIEQENRNEFGPIFPGSIHFKANTLDRFVNYVKAEYERKQNT